MPFRPQPNVKSITADYQVVAADNEAYLVAASGADIEFTLPAVAECKNHVFNFLNLQDFEMLITAPADTLVALHNAAADGISITTASNHIGGAIRIVSNGVKFFALNVSAAPTITVTVISA